MNFRDSDSNQIKLNSFLRDWRGGQGHHSWKQKTERYQCYVPLCTVRRQCVQLPPGGDFSIQAPWSSETYSSTWERPHYTSSWDSWPSLVPRSLNWAVRRASQVQCQSPEDRSRSCFNRRRTNCAGRAEARETMATTPVTEDVMVLMEGIASLLSFSHQCGFIIVLTRLFMWATYDDVSVRFVKEEPFQPQHHTASL